MKATYLDTHVVLWLRQGLIEKFSPKTKKILESYELFISPFVKLEIGFLFEIGRVLEKPDKILSSLADSVDLFERDISSSLVVSKAETIRWTRDPFDRLIVAQAMADNFPIVSKDRDIRDNYKKATW